MTAMTGLAFAGFICVVYAIISDERGDEVADKEFRDVMHCSPGGFFVFVALMSIVFIVLGFLRCIVPY